MILAACVLQLFTSRQNHRAQLDAAVCRARHLPRRLGGAQERRAARSPACASAGAARRPDSAADRKVRRRIAVKPVHASARRRPYGARAHFIHGVDCVVSRTAYLLTKASTQVMTKPRFSGPLFPSLHIAVPSAPCCSSAGCNISGL